MSKVKLYAIYALGALVLVGLAAWLFVGQQPSQGQETALRPIEIELQPVAEDNIQLVKDADVRAELYRHGIIPSPDSLWTELSPVQIKHQLQSNGIYSSVNVYQSPVSNRLVISLGQRSPLYIVQPSDPEQQPYYVCRDREVVPLNPEYKSYLPLVSGELSPEYATTALYDLMETIHSDSLWHDYFDHIYVDPARGVILSPRLYNTAIYIGRDGDWKARLHKLKVFEDKVMPKKGKNAYAYLKLQYSDQVVAKEK